MVTVPARLFELPNVRVFYRDADVCILAKSLDQDQYERPSYTSMHVLSVVREGRQRIEIADGPTLQIPAGRAIFLRRGLYTITDLIRAETGQFRAELLYFSGKGIVDRTGHKEAYDPKPFSFITDLPRSRVRALQLLADLPGISATLAAPHRQDPVAFLADHFDKPLTLDDLAYLTGMSVSSLQRQFRRQTGMSPGAWITRQRMERARQLLRQPGHRVAQVAALVGYTSTSHFIERYRAAYGHTPLTESRHFTVG
jgi:AraC-like DNA-binding protein